VTTGFQNHTLANARSCGLIDVHSRIGPDDRGMARPIEQALQEMEACGIRRAWVCPMDRYVAVRNREGNDLIAAAVASHPNRFIGCAVANPWYGQKALEELDRALNLGLRALFLLPPVQGFQLSDPLVDDLADMTAQRSAPIYAHTGTPVCCEPFQLTALARRHPTGRFIMGHMGFSDFWYDAIHAAAAADNVWLETSLIDPGTISRALKMLGNRRLVFGSDAPISAIDVELQKVLSMEAAPQDVQRILRDNAQELIP
jgi:hypothetical protein